MTLPTALVGDLDLGGVKPGHRDRLDTSHRATVDYYDGCWVPRFEEGHNARSLAIHYGLYDSTSDDPEDAKSRLNDYVAGRIGECSSTGLRVVDAGCGVGGTAIDLARAHRDWSIDCVNLGERQLRLADRFATTAGVRAQLNFHLRDYADTGLDASRYDAVFAVESLCHCENRTAFLLEARRLLRPGGRLLVVDFFRTARPLNRSESDEYERICDGFKISDYYDVPLSEPCGKVGLSEGEFEDLSDAVYPGVARSATRASAALRCPGVPTDFAAHYRTCIGIERFMVSGHLKYGSFQSFRI